MRKIQIFCCSQSLRKTEILRVAMSHAGQWLNTARRVLAHVRAYLDIGQYSECRDTERREALRCVGMAIHLLTESCQSNATRSDFS